MIEAGLQFEGAVDRVVMAFGNLPAPLRPVHFSHEEKLASDLDRIADQKRFAAFVGKSKSGFLLLGLPVGILATAFAEEIHRREFVVTWTMVASVPLFRGLDASGIAEIMRYLRAQSIPRGALIVRKGDPAHSMYFIAEGEVEVELPQEKVKLGEGQFFGEIAVLQKTSRTADVRASAPTKLLILDAYDLQTLTKRSPEIGEAIRDVMRSRSELAPAERHGDLIEAELEEPAATEQASEP